MALVRTARELVRVAENEATCICDQETILITHWPGINSKKLLFSFLKVFFIQIWFYEINSGLLHVEKVTQINGKHITGCLGEIIDFLFLKVEFEGKQQTSWIVQASIMLTIRRDIFMLKSIRI